MLGGEKYIWRESYEKKFKEKLINTFCSGYYDGDFLLWS